jgi:hypothetical protein
MCDPPRSGGGGGQFLNARLLQTPLEALAQPFVQTKGRFVYRLIVLDKADLAETFSRHGERIGPKPLRNNTDKGKR